MDTKSLPSKVKQEVSSFFEAVSGANELFYLILLTLYIAIYVELKMVFQGKVILFVERARYAVLGIVMWGMAIYLFFIIATWKNLWKDSFWLILIGGLLLFLVGFFSRKMSTNAYGVVFDIVFCLMACGKSFRKMLHCILGTVVAGLVIAGIGIPLGFTLDLGKPDTSTPGHSLGINYPNTWAYILFLALMLLWYLYLRNRPLLTFAVFWAAAAVNWFYILCRTISGLTVIFPFLALLVDWLERRSDRKAAEGSYKQNKVFKWFFTAVPFIAFAVMMYLSMIVDWMHQFYHGPLRNLAWRFIQGGLYFRTYGLPIVGNPYRSNQYTYVNVNGEFIKVGILDSSFAAYIIMRGMLWLFAVLIWLAIANWKGMKKRDYAVPFLETIILGFAMMERPGLEMWFNFILLYPLAKTMSKAGTKPVLEFTGSVAAASEMQSDSAAENDTSISDDEVTASAPRESVGGPASDMVDHAESEDVVQNEVSEEASYEPSDTNNGF